MFYKMQGQEFYFQLVNLSQPLEEYVLWKENEKFPIRESVNGVSPRDAYWDNTKLPGYRGDRSFIRDIIVNSGGINTQYAFSFKKRDNDQLIAEINKIINLQHKNPLTFRFKYRKTGQGKETIRVVVAMDEVGLPVNVQSSSQETPITLEQANKQYNLTQEGLVPITSSNVVAQPSQGGFEIPKPQTEVPDKDELQVIQWANDYQDKLDEQQFIEGFNYSLKKNFNKVVADERARKWFYQYYKDE